jgi:hypothetical protein
MDRTDNKREGEKDDLGFAKDGSGVAISRPA